MYQSFSSRLQEYYSIYSGVSFSGYALFDVWLDSFDPNTLYPGTQWKIWLSDPEIGEYVQMLMYLLYSFTVPSRETITAISDFIGPESAHEYMAGTGWWNVILKNNGVLVTASDINIPCYAFEGLPRLSIMETRDIITFDPIPGEAVIIIYPEGNEKILNFITKMKLGDKLVLISDLSTLGKDTSDYLTAHFTGPVSEIVCLPKFNAQLHLLTKEGS